MIRRTPPILRISPDIHNVRDSLRAATLKPPVPAVIEEASTPVAVEAPVPVAVVEVVPPVAVPVPVAVEEVPSPVAVEPAPVVAEPAPVPVVEEVPVAVETVEPTPVVGEVIRSDLTELLEGSVSKVVEQLETGAYDSRLDEILSLETQGKARKGVKVAIEARKG